MATREVDIDLGGQPDKKAGGMKTWLITAGGALVLVAASIGGTVAMLGGDKAAPAPAPTTTPSKPDTPPSYMALEPPFVVNFEDQGAIRFLQVTVEVMTRDPKVTEAITLHTPVIRDQMIVLFSSSDYPTLSSREGKEDLRQQALATLKRILDENGAPDTVEGLYFTNFVMQ
ncbi:MAG TPA: flagellar basal body protein FliL [Gammaproteobacteria bacterium]|uniref:flagellar basal body-associated FliL family protein n=1 Tax=Immundisolibacter sp. TaxID=1934948 RepID=UPI000E9A28B1|nr:flagellar basal body protein FliL [Gammaproteobacteria bacterium]MCH78050.1 flagellar basal body protein FliL [Gammaproteobacteria bacterium]